MISSSNSLAVCINKYTLEISLNFNKFDWWSFCSAFMEWQTNVLIKKLSSQRVDRSFTCAICGWMDFETLLKLNFTRREIKIPECSMSHAGNKCKFKFPSKFQELFETINLSFHLSSNNFRFERGHKKESVPYFPPMGQIGWFFFTIQWSLLLIKFLIVKHKNELSRFLL